MTTNKKTVAIYDTTYRFKLKKKIEKIKITSCEDVYKHCLKKRFNAQQEVFYILGLNGANDVIKVFEAFKGSLNSALVHPELIFKFLILADCVSFIVAHNHPSGNLEPSDPDILITERLAKSGELLGIELLDHIIFSGQEALSLKKRGFI